MANTFVAIVLFCVSASLAVSALAAMAAHMNNRHQHDRFRIYALIAVTCNIATSFTAGYLFHG